MYSSHCSACRLQSGWRATRDSYRALAEMVGGWATHMVRMLVPCRFAHWVLGVRWGVGGVGWRLGYTQHGQEVLLGQ